MAKYIECEAVKKSIIECFGDLSDKDAEYIIENVPDADVVEVVRCKDCKYFEIDEEDELGECKCGYISVSYGGTLYPHRTDYCSYGERKCNK